MKILIITQRWYPDTFGGSEHVAAQQAFRLAGRGHTVTVLTQRANDLLPPSETHGSFTIYRYGSPQAIARIAGRSRTDLVEVPKFLRHLDRAQRVERSHTPQGVGSLGSARDDQLAWDVAILHHPFAAYGFFSAQGGSGLKIPTLYMFHASTAQEVEFEGVARFSHGFGKIIAPLATKVFTMWAIGVERRALIKADRIAVFSDFSRGVLLGIVPETHRRVIKLPVGIELDHFVPMSKEQARRKLGLQTTGPLILTVRRFTPRMGVSRLIAAMDIVLKKISDAHLFIVGEGYLKPMLQAAIVRHGLGSKVTLVGTVPLADLPLYYGAADAFVLPSEAFEGLGMATLEALSCGLPVIGTPTGATPEILRDLDPALITASSSSADIARGIEEYFGRPQAVRDALQKRARELAEKQYNWDPAIDALEGVLEGLRIK